MSKSAVSILIVVSLAVGGVAGYGLAFQTAKDMARKEFQAVLDLAFPPPPKELKAISGTIKSISGNSFVLEADDPEDYLPHPDGSPRKKITRTVTIAENAWLSFIDYSQFDEQGNPKTVQMKADDLRTGDTVTVRAEANIRTTTSFTASAVDLVKY